MRIDFGSYWGELGSYEKLAVIADLIDHGMFKDKAEAMRFWETGKL